MAGQGKTTRLYATRLTDEGWKVLFICIPNSPHVGVVPIPTSHGVSKQRYPDIAALKNDQLLLVEVEMGLSDAVSQDIVLRFNEMRQALGNPALYRSWSQRVGLVSGHEMPLTPRIESRLLLVNGFDERSINFVKSLELHNISVERA
jgi:hypothetical protein